MPNISTGLRQSNTTHFIGRIRNSSAGVGYDSDPIYNNCMCAAADSCNSPCGQSILQL